MFLSECSTCSYLAFSIIFILVLWLVFQFKQETKQTNKNIKSPEDAMLPPERLSCLWKQQGQPAVELIISRQARIELG